jgi:hypothetical protein
MTIIVQYRHALLICVCIGTLGVAVPAALADTAKLTTLYSFGGPDGANPSGSLTGQAAG